MQAVGISSVKTLRQKEALAGSMCKMRSQKSWHFKYGSMSERSGEEGGLGQTKSDLVRQGLD